MSVGTNIQTIYFNKPVQLNAQMTFRSQTVPSKDYPLDTFEISDKIKTKQKTKKALTIIGGLTVLGISITYAVKKVHVKNIKNVQKIFQDVFLRDDITEKEAKEMLNRYKEIEKIKDTKEYANALFEEAKKNYRMNDTDIKLVFDLPCKNAKNASGFYSEKDQLISITTTQNRRHILNTMHHEFRHAVQHRAGRTSEYSLQLRAMIDKYTTDLINNTPDIDLSDPKITQELTDIINRAKKELKEKGFPKNDKDLIERLEFERKLAKNKFTVPEKYSSWADKCVEQRLYHDVVKPDDNFKAYYEQFVEKDARYAGSAIDKFVKGKAFSLDWLLNKKGVFEN